MATSYALPEQFPHRDLILLSTFAVVLGTLALQGLTLGPLIRLLKIEDDGMLDREVKSAREAVTEAGLKHVQAIEGPAAKRLQSDYESRLKALRAADADEGRIYTDQERLLGDVLEAKRDVLHRLRMSGEIGEAAYFQLEEELDRHELSLTPVVR